MPAARKLALPPPPLDFAAFDRFVHGRPEHERWELFDGEIEMQPFPTTIHQRVVMNLIYDLEHHAENTNAPWLVLPGARLDFRAQGRRDSRIPDVVVMSGEAQHGAFIEDALFLAEVSSPGDSARRRDLRLKRALYATLPTLAGYLVVDTQEATAILHAREDGFEGQPVTGPDAPFAVPALGLSLTLRRLFRRTPLLA
jgi:Uma2 family endonuclease